MKNVPLYVLQKLIDSTMPSLRRQWKAALGEKALSWGTPAGHMSRGRLIVEILKYKYGVTGMAATGEETLSERIEFLTLSGKDAT